MTAREHAEKASELLNGIDDYRESVKDAWQPDQIANANAVIAYTVNLAQAHAQVSLALSATECT